MPIYAIAICVAPLYERKKTKPKVIAVASVNLSKIWFVRTMYEIVCVAIVPFYNASVDVLGI